jgi:mercuric ion transport protein
LRLTSARWSFAITSTSRQSQQTLGIGKGKSQVAATLNQPEPGDAGRIVDTVAAFRALRSWQDARAFVVPDRLDRDAAYACGFANGRHEGLLAKFLLEPVATTGCIISESTQPGRPGRWRKTMNNNRTLKTGIIGSIIMALCCFTPLLVVLLGALGLSAAVGWLDFVLLPALAVFLSITGYALWKRNRAE